jgi:hypothetical protein
LTDYICYNTPNFEWGGRFLSFPEDDGSRISEKILKKSRIFDRCGELFTGIPFFREGMKA